MEFIPAHQRGRWQGRLAFISNLGLPVSAFIGWVVIPLFGWRSMFAFVGVSSLLAWMALRRMTESPRWYESRKRYKEADALLNRIEAEVEGATGLSLLPVIPASAAGSQTEERKASVATLFQGALRRRTILAVILMVCMNITLYAFTAWFPTILVRSGVAIS